MQPSFLPGLARRGALRAQIEAVRVHETYRGRGLGEQMLNWAIAEAKHRGCAVVQLTSDKSRSDADRVYERLGFVAFTRASSSAYDLRVSSISSRTGRCPPWCSVAAASPAVGLLLFVPPGPKRKRRSRSWGPILCPDVR